MISVKNPRTGQVDYQIPATSADEIAAVSQELRTAQQHWREIGVDARCRALQSWASEIEKKASAIGEALCIDTGRRMMSHFEVQSLIASISRWTEQAPALMQNNVASNSAIMPSVEYRHQLVPYPLVGIISPWNFPLTLAMIDTLPALLSGASVLLKPSEVTPRFIAPLQETLDSIPELSAVLKIVTGGADTGIAMIDQVDTICFTGSVITGRKVAVQAAQNFIPGFLELGGKDPAIVLPSADVDNAATAILRSAVGMSGQACQSLERVYVHETLYDEFLATITSKAKAIKYNWPHIDEGQIGPLIFADQATTISKQLALAVSAGAVVHCGGTIEHHGGGHWIAPTIISEVDHSMAIMSEETFGPILPIMKYATTEQALMLANDSIYGLSGAVFSSDRNEAETVAEQMEVGAVSINDAGLTGFVHDAEKNSFALSGMGGSRMGDAGLTRFLRKRALLFQTAPATPLEVFSEGKPK